MQEQGPGAGGRDHHGRRRLRPWSGQAAGLPVPSFLSPPCHLLPLLSSELEPEQVRSWAPSLLAPPLPTRPALPGVHSACPAVPSAALPWGPLVSSPVCV